MRTRGNLVIVAILSEETKTMKNLKSIYLSRVDAVATLLTTAGNKHSNERAQFLEAAMKSIEKLKFEIARELQELKPLDKPKPGDYKLVCELCTKPLLSLRALVLGIHVPHYICTQYWGLNENTKRCMNIYLPRDMQLQKSSFREVLLSVAPPTKILVEYELREVLLREEKSRSSEHL